jgi:hypothetical protein
MESSSGLVREEVGYILFFSCFQSKEEFSFIICHELLLWMIGSVAGSSVFLPGFQPLFSV